MSWFTGDPTYDTILFISFVLVGMVVVAARVMQSPYGRFASPRFGLSLDPRLGWFLMELPATLSFLYFFSRGQHAGELVPMIFCAVWLVHYANRGFIFPSLMRVPRGKAASFGLLVVVSGWMVTTLHGYLNGAYFSEFGDYPESWLHDPRFQIGIVIYFCGLALNVHSDAIVRNLRTREEVAAGIKRYRIPRGGLFRWVSSPSYFAELMAWTGFALFTWSPGALFILGISAANLIPRAFATHRWYHEKFPDYPQDRKVLVPWIL